MNKEELGSIKEIITGIVCPLMTIWTIIRLQKDLTKAQKEKKLVEKELEALRNKIDDMEKSKIEA